MIKVIKGLLFYSYKENDCFYFDSGKGVLHVKKYGNNIFSVTSKMGQKFTFKFANPYSGIICNVDGKTFESKITNETVEKGVYFNAQKGDIKKLEFSLLKGKYGLMDELFDIKPSEDNSFELVKNKPNKLEGSSGEIWIKILKEQPFSLTLITKNNQKIKFGINYHDFDVITVLLGHYVIPNVKKVNLDHRFVMQKESHKEHCFLSVDKMEISWKDKSGKTQSKELELDKEYCWKDFIEDYSCQFKHYEYVCDAKITVYYSDGKTSSDDIEIVVPYP